MLPRKVVDSIMALFRVDFSGRGELSERQQKVMYSGFLLEHHTYRSHCSWLRCDYRPYVHMQLTIRLLQMLSKLSKISEEFNASLMLLMNDVDLLSTLKVAILITNQVQCQ
jgi:hypothetical protein